MGTRPNLDEIALRRRRWLAADKRDGKQLELATRLIDRDLRALIEYIETDPPIRPERTEGL